MIIAEIKVPLLNANEPDAMLATIHGKEEGYVKKDDVLFTIETTKATSEIVSPTPGYLRLLKKEGDSVRVGEILAVITQKAGEKFDVDEFKKANHIGNKDDLIPGLRITKPAEKLALTLGVDIGSLPKDKLITEDVIRKFYKKDATPTIDISVIEKDPILIYGGGGHAKTVIEMIRIKNEYTIVGIVDDDESRTGSSIMGIPILGTRARLPELSGMGIRHAVNCVGGILDVNIRMRITNIIKSEGFIIPALIHPSAIIEPSSTLAEGVQVMAGAYVGAEAIIGEDSMINTSVVISHDCVIGRHTHIAPGSLLAGNVSVGDRSLIGMGVTTALGIEIGSSVRIGNGAIILATVPDNMIIQAGRHWAGKAG